MSLRGMRIRRHRREAIQMIVETSLRSRYRVLCRSRGAVTWAGVLVALLGVSRALPLDGVGLWLRLTAATAIVLLPGAAIAVKLELPAASTAISGALALLAVALAIMFAFRSSLWLALLLYCAGGAAAVAVASRLPAVPRPRHLALGSLTGLGFGALLWPVAGVLTGDALFHLARVRKLAAFGGLSLSSVDEFRDGGLHPGYAFPLWHGFLAVVARVAHVDPTAVVLHEASVLAPFAILVAFEAGRAVFDSAATGAAAAIAQVSSVAIAPGHGGAYVSLALPATAARQILVPAVLALGFQHARKQPDGRDGRLAPRLLAIGAAGSALALAHVTYALFLAIALVGTLVVRSLFDRRDAAVLAVRAGAFAAATGAVLAWLAPLAATTRSHNASCSEIDRAFVNYGGQIVHKSCSDYRLAPEVVARSGAIAVAALLLVPLAAFAARRRWSALVLGATLAILICVLPTWIFPRFADVVSISQARRAAGFLPLPFALAGGATVLAWFLGRWTLALALASGIALEIVYPGSFAPTLAPGLPAFPTWVALFGGLLALFTAAIVRPARSFERTGPLPLLSVALFTIPVAVAGFLHWTPLATSDPNGVSAGIRQTLARPPLRGSIVFSDPGTSYDVAAYAPVYVADAPPPHVADTPANDPYRRRDDAARFLRTGALAIPRRYGACTILLRRPARRKLPLHVLYRDKSFVLYALNPVWRRGACR